jgi:arylsulfatase A-like enzyme
MCEWFDETVGELLGYLDKQGLRENTLVVFTCDNGWSTASSNADDPNQKLFRSYAQRTKGSPYEGGTRNPILLSWPKRITPEDSSDLAHAIDLFPTIVSAAGGEVPAGLSGINLLDEKARKQRDTLFGVNHSTHNMTLGDPDDTLQYIWCIEGKWKLIKRYQGKDISSHYGALHKWDTAAYHLYDLKNDPNEWNDLADAMADRVKRMSAKIDQWRKDTKG